MRDTDSWARAIRDLYLMCVPQLQDWTIEDTADPIKTWIYFTQRAVKLPSQGWKLHISASVASAEVVARRILPILLRETGQFKIVRSLDQLQLLNQGEAGGSQVGKFVTIYPRDEEEAVRLAMHLHEATRGLSGPHVPSDRALRPDSLVHYRYGCFRFRSYRQTLTGSIEATLRTPDNQEVPDRRQLRYEALDWVNDPFVAAGIAADLPVFDRIIGERYLIVSTIFASINHIVYLGADIEQGRSCIIKGPGYAWQNNLTDRTMDQRLAHEASVLTQLAPHPRLPRLYDVVEHRGDRFLILEDIEGENLGEYISHMLHRGMYLPLPQVIAWGQELAEIIEYIHTSGFVYGDLKSANVIVGADQHLYLIDFDLAHRQTSADSTPEVSGYSGCSGEPGGSGTPGYMSPQQRQGLPITIHDDIYTFGALCYFLATGAEPSYAPRHARLLRRPLEWLRPGGVAPLKDIIERCLQEQPEDRYPSMYDVRAALEQVQQTLLVEQMPAVAVLTSLCGGGETSAEPQCLLQREHYRDLSSQVMESIGAQARPTPDGVGLGWASMHTLSHGLFARDINTGNAGTLLALSELVAAHAQHTPPATSATAVDSQADEWVREISVLRETLEQAAHWLSQTRSPSREALPGLYVGEAGVGAALLRAGQTLHDERLLIAALQQGRAIAPLAHRSADLFHGTAGRLRFHLLLWDETGEQEQMDYALACGQTLLAREREVSWAIPKGFGDLSGQIQLGYAHGLAGIADALLDLDEARGEEYFAPWIKVAARWLIRQALPALEDQSGLNWPRVVGGPANPPYWCHGGAGIGRFFLHLAQTGLMQEGLEIAARAARTVASVTRWSGPTQCHGLAGNCEFLLDMYQATGEQSYLQQALLLGRLLEAFAEQQDGHLVFSADSPAIYTPDYMVGYAGVALCLLRLSDPERLPSQLSRAGFRVRYAP